MLPPSLQRLVDDPVTSLPDAIPLRMCPVDKNRGLRGDTCTYSPCMNNLNGYCRRPDVLKAEGNAEAVCSLFRLSESSLHTALNSTYCAVVADKFFQYFLQVSLTQASNAEFDAVLASPEAFTEWNKSTFTFDQVSDVIKLIRSRL